MTEMTQPGANVDPFAVSTAVPVDEMVPMEVAAVPVKHGIKVNEGNILQAAKIIATVLEREQAKVEHHLMALRIEPMAGDPVSVEAAEAWNRALLDGPDSYRARVVDYLLGLNTLVSNITDSAKQYGYNEDDIAAVMNSITA